MKRSRLFTFILLLVVGCSNENLAKADSLCEIVNNVESIKGSKVNIKGELMIDFEHGHSLISRSCSQYDLRVFLAYDSNLFCANSAENKKFIDIIVPNSPGAVAPYRFNVEVSGTFYLQKTKHPRYPVSSGLIRIGYLKNACVDSFSESIN